jgi:LPXTG-site transpeptidase (sortase) family protein
VLVTAVVFWIIAFSSVRTLATIAAVMQEQELQQAAEQPRALQALAAAVHADTDDAAAAVQAPYPYYGETIGSVSVPSSGIEVAVVHGDSDEILISAAGQSPLTGLPGEGLRIVIGAHTNTYFNTLGAAQLGDEVVFSTYYGNYTYEVAETFIFEETEFSILDSTGSEELLLYTCYPFGELGRTTQRYAVLCQLVEGSPVQWT